MISDQEIVMAILSIQASLSIDLKNLVQVLPDMGLVVGRCSILQKPYYIGSNFWICWM